MTVSSLTHTEYDAIKARQRATWASGDYATIGTTLQLVGETLSEAVDIAAGEHVLDVAAGNGNAALAAARRGAEVVASDYVPQLLDRLLSRAYSEGLPIETREADAEVLPFKDESFDVVLSVFGVMFTPNQERAAAELLRVTRPGGRIGLANWTPTGFIGRMLKTVGRYVPPPTGIRSPSEWGTEERLAALLDGGVQAVYATPRQFIFRYRSPQQWLDVFRSYYGPGHRAFAALDEAQQESLVRDLLDLAAAYNTSTTGGMRVPSDYLEVVAIKR